MKLPVTIAGRDAVVGVADGEVALGHVITAVTGAGASGQNAAVASGVAGVREVATGVPVIDLALRPGDEVLPSGSVRLALPADGWAVHVIAGSDAGRTIPLARSETALAVTVGRGADAMIRLSGNGVSSHHCTLIVGHHAVAVQDAGSSNGTVVKGRRIGSEPVVIAAGEPIRCGPAVIAVRPLVGADTPAKVADLLANAPTGPVPFYRSPVDLAPPPGDDIEPPSGPRRPRGGRPGLIGFLLPLLMAAALVKFTGQLMYALFALMSPVMMLVTSLDRGSRNRKVRKKSRRRYRQELVDFTNELNEALDYEMGRRRAMCPDAAEIVRRAAMAGAALWTRRRDHPQFLHVALGLADLEWKPPLTNSVDDEPDLQLIVDDAGILPLAPLAVPATPGSIIGLAGNRAAAAATARGMLAQIAVMQGPAEVRIVVATSAEHATDWDWAKWLPHMRPAFAGGRLLSIVADENGRLDGATIDDVLADVDAGAVVVALIDTDRLADAGDLAIRRLLRRGDGATAGIVIAPGVDGLPDQCEVVVDHHEATGEATARWPRDGGRTEEIVTTGMPIAAATALARHLARLSDPDAGGGSATMPARTSHAELLGLRDARPVDVTNHWRSGGPLAPVIGVGANGTMVVDLERDGPHLLVVGGRGSGKSEQLASIVLSLAATQAPEHLHLVVWGESFTHLNRLPHAASSANRIDDATVGVFLDGVERELARRERMRTLDHGDREGNPLANVPRLVIVIDDVDTIMRVVPVASERLVRLYRRCRGLGVHVVWSASRHNGGVIADLVDLSTIRIVLRVASGPDSTDLIGSDAASRLERSLPGRGYVVSGRNEPKEVQGGAVSIGTPRPSEELEVAPFTLVTGRAQFADGVLGPPDERGLVALITAAGATSARPPDILSPAAAAAQVLESPGLLDLLGLTDLDSITDTWHTTDAESFLRVPIGVDQEMRPVLLDIKESALNGMGPHGLLVGATGAGKSELLRTLVCGLAVTHSPEALAMVLVDFKGGASFATLGRLPHVAGVVTNLADDLALVDRILAALGGEQRRRQELLAAAGNLANAREYRALRAAGKLPPHLADQPFPNLLIVVDEFAELLDQEPAFIDFFLTIGRVGRSLGIHLLLASQRLEEGKLRGLDTYLSYRLGLRTFSATESRIVLGVPDAYSLPSAPGGGYLKVGTTSFERFQASYVSGPSDLARPGDEGTTEPITVLDAIIERLAGAAERVHQVWLPPMDGANALDRLFPHGFVHDPKRGFAAAGWPGTGVLAVPVGILDEPARQRQLPLVLDFAGAQGNLAVCGAPQSGKSVLLRSMVLSLAVTHTPDEVQLYAIDFGGGTLASVADLPHVGTVASRLDPELAQRLVGHVESLLAEREALFGARGIDSVNTFRQLRLDGKLTGVSAADVFLVIDGWAAFRERFEGLEPVIADLASRGLGYGIHVVITANRWMEFRANVIDAIGGRLELRLNSALDSAIDRKRAAIIRADQPGRGLHPSTLLHHVSVPRLDGLATTELLSDATAVAVEHIAARWEGDRAPAVRLLPTLITVREIEAQEQADANAFAIEITNSDVGAPAGAVRPGVVVGLAEPGMAPWRFDLGGSEPHFMVFGDGESGKTTFLDTWLRGLSERVPATDAQIVLVDYRRTLLETVPPDHLYGYAASEPAARDVIAAVSELATSRLPGANVTAAQLRNRSWWTGPEVYVVVDDYDLVVTPSGNPLAPLLPLIAQGRDVGLHIVLSRRVSGAAKAMYEPITARIREVSNAGLILSGERDEGPIIGPIRASIQPPGRGILIAKRQPPMLVQVAWTESVEDEAPTGAVDPSAHEASESTPETPVAEPAGV